MLYWLLFKMHNSESLKRESRGNSAHNVHEKGGGGGGGLGGGFFKFLNFFFISCEDTSDFFISGVS